jgi:hypothetical protein
MRSSSRQRQLLTQPYPVLIKYIIKIGIRIGTKINFKRKLGRIVAVVTNMCALECNAKNNKCPMSMR